MKKKYIVILLIVMFGLGIGVDKLLFTNNDIDDGFNDLSQVKRENMLSMMLEQNAGAGDYELETRSSWPTKEDGYIFNSTLSKCEKGSNLRWDDVNKVVVMVGTTSDKCYVYFDKYNAITINSSSATVSGNSIIVSIDASAGDGAISKYYYSKDNGLSYVDSANNTYTFTGLTTGDYTIKCYVEDSNGKTSEVITKQLSVVSVTLASWVKSQYTGTQGENSLYYHNGTIKNADGNVVDAADNSYRYAGKHNLVNNFVCFGTGAEECPDDNLYRIIGVFDVDVNGATESRVKLIKWDYANNDLLGTNGDYYSSSTYLASNYSNYKGSKTSIDIYYWNKSTEKNTWSESNLNKINLNTNYLAKMDTIWTDKIATTKWIVGGNTSANVTSYNAKTAYISEITNPTENTIYSSKVGLMYVNDYYYGAFPTYWTYPSYSSSDSIDDYQVAIDYNWMFMGLHEWSIVRTSDNTYTVFYVCQLGYAQGHLMDSVTSKYAVRPVFYLNSDVTKVGNNIGSKTDPIRIN